MRSPDLPSPAMSLDLAGGTCQLEATERTFLVRAVELAVAAEARGNLPIAALLTLDGEAVAEGVNETLRPHGHPGRHAEVQALAAVPLALLSRLPEMTCYTTLEPCVMCFGALVLHRVGRVVFGAADPHGGAVRVGPHLPPAAAAEAAAVEWVGPAWPEACDPLFRRAAAIYWAAAAPAGATVVDAGIVVDTDRSRLDVDVVHGFLRETYWSKGIARGVVERAIAGSLCFGVYDDGRQVGFARVISDGATFAYLADVFVLESHRGRGLAQRLLDAVTAHPALQGLRRWMLATRDAHALYAHYDFAPLAAPEVFMERHDPGVYARSRDVREEP